MRFPASLNGRMESHLLILIQQARLYAWRFAVGLLVLGWGSRAAQSFSMEHYQHHPLLLPSLMRASLHRSRHGCHRLRNENVVARKKQAQDALFPQAACGCARPHDSTDWGPIESSQPWRVALGRLVTATSSHCMLHQYLYFGRVESAFSFLFPSLSFPT